MDINSPIGVFDSGVGGLTVFRQLRKILPAENIIYFGDNKRNPYGPRSEREILQFVEEILDFMMENNVKMAVSACNTISVLLDKLPLKYPFEVVGMGRGVLMALAMTHSRRIGVLATETTIRSGKHVAEVMVRNSEIKIFPIACPKFAPLVEAECLEGEAVEAAALDYVMPLKDAKVDAVILACTHYPMLAPVISKVLGPAYLVDPAEETALEVKNILGKAGLLKATGEGYSRLCFSADIDRARRIASKIMDNRDCEFELLDMASYQEHPTATTCSSL
jgi:glutamate racemase